MLDEGFLEGRRTFRQLPIVLATSNTHDPGVENDNGREFFQTYLPDAQKSGEILRNPHIMADAEASNNGGYSSGVYSSVVDQADASKSTNATDLSISRSSRRNAEKYSAEKY